MAWVTTLSALADASPSTALCPFQDPTAKVNSSRLNITRLVEYPLICVVFTRTNPLPNSLGMAEVVGTFASAVTIAALFKACVDAFDMVQAARHQEADYNRLLLKFNIEKCRLYTWGQMMRLTSTLQPDEARPLDEFQFRDVVIQTLQTLYDLFDDSKRIQERYGCGKAPALAIDGGDEAQLTRPLAAAFLHFPTGPHNGGELKLGQKTRWVIRDRRKFAELVSEIRDLVDGLQEITKSIAPIILQQSAMTSRITAVADVETLQSVSEVCEEDHPLFSQAASLKSEVLSMGDARRMEIEAWLADGTPPLDPDMTDLENMDLPELKHHLFLLSKQRQQLEDDYNKIIQLSSNGRARLDDGLELIMAKTRQETKSIKLLSYATLFFLPGTFVSTVMSTSQFQLDVLNRTDFWMYWATAVPLTAYTVAVYWIINRKAQDKTTQEDQNQSP
ncbi:MAG: hypothetical protein Q9167_002678 [Letrouitia subvulpina]